MQKFQTAITSPTGDIIPNAVITILTSTGSIPIIYAGNGVNPYPTNQVTTNSQGEFSFYAANGRYSYTVAATNFVTEAYTDFLLFDPADAPSGTYSIDTEYQLATAGQTVITLTQITYIPGSNNLSVYINGVRLILNVDYAETSSTQVTFTNALALNDEVVCVVGAEISQAVDSANVGFLQAGTGAVSRSVQSRLRDAVSVKDFGAVGDGVTDDTAAIQAAITACIANSKSLYIPKANYVLAGQLTVGTPIDIYSDKNATMRWTTASSGSIGIVLDFDSGGDNLCSIELPCLFSPAINSSFQIPNYNAAASYNYNLASRIGNAIYLKGGNRINLSAQYICGFTNGLLAEATVTATCDNVNFTVNTMDFCEKGVNLLCGSASALGFSQFVFNANTVWAKFLIYLDLTYGYVLSSRFTIAGGAFVNEDGGCGVYCVGGANFADNVIDINFLEAGRRSDSVPATTVNLVCPFLGGDSTSNGLSYDGMGTSPNIGYFGGKRSELFFGTYYGSIVSDLGSASPTPTAGRTIRIRDAGVGNRVRVRYADFANTAAAPIASTATVGEANYNSGVGGAQYGRAIYSSSTVNLLAGAAVTHYIYHQCTSPLGFRPYTIVPRDSGVGSNQLSISAFPTGTTNREIQIYIRNNGTATFNSTVNYWLIVE